MSLTRCNDGVIRWLPGMPKASLELVQGDFEEKSHKAYKEWIESGTNQVNGIMWPQKRKNEGDDSTRT